MILRGVNLRDLTLAHLQQLVDNQVPEGRSIEYKSALPSAAEADKKEFLADVSALANTEGGLLIFGMATERDEKGRDTGIAKSCDGVPIANVDGETQRLSSMLRDSLDPQLTRGFAIHPIATSTAGHYMLVIGVDRSLIGPHRVTFQRSDKYWRRGEGGKYTPDTSELRRVFLEADSWNKEADEFHRMRLAEIRRSAKYATHFCLVHVLPLGRLNTNLHQRALQPDIVIAATPMFAMGADWRYNAAGFKVFVRRAGTGEEHYVQWLRFGGVEAAASSFAMPQEAPDDARRINVEGLRANIDRFVTAAHGIIRNKLDLSPPYYLGLSLSGIGGTAAFLGGLGASWDAKLADEDPVVFPPIVLLGDESLSSALQLWWDTLWQTYGLPQAPPSAS